MAFVTLPVRFHQQDGQTSCGPASAQMIVAQFSGQTIDQKDLTMALGETPGNPSTTSPDWLAGVLEKYRTSLCPDLAGTFRFRTDGCAETALRRIRRAIEAAGVGVATLVWDDHWVVVTGMVLDEATSRIKGVFVHDPLPQTAFVVNAENPKYQPPLPHGSGDKCGLGNEYGSPNTYVTTYAWKRHYWYAPYRDRTAAHATGYVTVFLELREHAPSMAERDSEQVDETEVETQPERTIGLADAMRIVSRGIDSHGLAETGPLAGDLRGAAPNAGAASESHPDDGDDYWIVSLVRDGRPTALGYADAVTGDFLGVQAPPSESPPPLEAESLVIAALRADPNLGLREANLDALVVHARRIWRPCYESMSPYSPFIRCTLSNTDYYVSPSGQCFTELHDGHER